MAALEFAKTCMEAEEWVPKTGRIVELKQAIAQIFNQKEVGLLPAALANKKNISGHGIPGRCCRGVAVQHG